MMGTKSLRSQENKKMCKFQLCKVAALLKMGAQAECSWTPLAQGVLYRQQNHPDMQGIPGFAALVRRPCGKGAKGCPECKQWGHQQAVWTLNSPWRASSLRRGSGWGFQPCYRGGTCDAHTEAWRKVWRMKDKQVAVMWTLRKAI